MGRRDGYIFTDEPRRGHGVRNGFLVILVLVIAALFTWNLVSNNTVVYTREYVTISQLPNDLENWTILHLSDLNGQDLGSHQSAVRTAIGSRSYSCVVLSGNMVGNSGDVKPVLDLIALLPEGTPILLLPGDSDPPLYATKAHSSLSAYADWAVALQEAGVTILDEPIAFERAKGTIWFTPEALYTLNLDGAENAYQDQLDALNAQVASLDADQAAMKRYLEFQVSRMQRIREKTDSMQENHIQVVVSHMPLTAESLRKARAAGTSAAFSLARASLVLSGGYCGGQWRIPGVGAVYVPELGFFPEDEQIMGMGYLSGTWQHISPGLGASSEYPFMPFRLFNSPGATLLVLTTEIH